MCNLNKHETEIRKKMQMTEASLEGVNRRLEEYDPDSDVMEGLQWAFQDLREKIDEVLKEAQQQY